MSSSRAITVDLPLHLIQAIRLTQALAESSFAIHVPRPHAATFRYLESIFGIPFLPFSTKVPVLDGLRISHEAPLSVIGSLQRPLVFPHGAFEYCLARWAPIRDIDYSFAGLITDKRRATLEAWAQRAFPELAGKHGPQIRLGNRIKVWLDRNLRGREPLIPQLSQNDTVALWSSVRGRRFPIKAWDREYYGLLCRSKFVMCPDGDFIWTYRFFEAIMCGAIPIIESQCDLYRGFRCFTLDDGVKTLEWSEETARHNFDLSRERLTLPRDELDREIESLLASTN